MSVKEGQESISRKLVLALVVVHSNVVLIPLSGCGYSDIREFQVRDAVETSANVVRRNAHRTSWWIDTTVPEAIDIGAIGGARRSDVNASGNLSAGLIAQNPKRAS